MKSGKIVRSFFAKDGRKVVLRTPKWEDLDDFLEIINSLVDEGADILRTERVSKEEEIDFLSKVLSRLEKDEMFYLVAEVDGKVVAKPGRGFYTEMDLGIVKYHFEIVAGKENFEWKR